MGSEACAHIAELGDLKELQRLREDNFYMGGACEGAANKGNLVILQWVYEHGGFDEEDRRDECHKAAIRAVEADHLEVLAWLHAKDPKMIMREDLYIPAAKRGDLRMIQWLREHKCPIWGSKLCEEAAKGGYLEILQWYEEQGCDWSETTCAKAAEENHFEVLQWLHAKKCPWDEETTEGAAFCGNLKMLQWARKHGCPWNAAVCRVAVENGHLQILQWAMAQGCPYQEEIWEEAAMYGHLNILEWGLKKGHQWENGCTWAAEEGELKILQCLLENDCPVDADEIFDVAKRNGNHNMMHWIIDNLW